MWFFIFGTLALMGLLAVFYLTWCFLRFSPLARLREGHPVRA